MSGLTLRGTLRLLLLGWVIASGMLSFAWFLCLGKGGKTDVRIAWMQWMSRRFLSLLHCEVNVVGNVPESGLIACNHLGYVDILVIGSVCPAVFVAKSDVKDWPIFGWLASRAGTIFVSRNAPASVASQLRRMEEPLSQGHPVVLFPEGTSSDGTSILPLRSSLFESVIATGSMITPAAISYDLGIHGSVGTEIAYWGNHVLLPHLVNLLSKKSFTSHITFGNTRKPQPDRKHEAAFLHTEISNLHASL